MISGFREIGITPAGLFRGFRIGLVNQEMLAEVSQMKTRLWVVLLIGLAVAAGIVSLAVAGENGFDKIAPPSPGVSTDAKKAEVKGVMWWKNGVSQGNIAFTGAYGTERVGAITVDDGDFVMFKVKGLYTGTGTAYLLFEDYTNGGAGGSGYGESWLLQPGVLTTKWVGRAYRFDSSTWVRVEAHKPGSDYDDLSPGTDWTRIYVTVV
jgi:hypothetical protein